MKKILFFIAVLSIGCSKEKAAQQTIQHSRLDTEKEMVRTAIEESGVRDLILHKEGKDWQYVDAFYKDMLDKFKDNDQLNYLRGYVITVLARNYGLTEIEGEEMLPVIEYYTNEQLTLTTPNPDVLLHCLERLNGYWDVSQISNAAKIGYEKNESTLNYLAGKSENPIIKTKKEYTEKLKKLVID